MRAFEQVIVPFQGSRGMVFSGSFTDENDPDGFFQVRRFEGERARLYAAT